MLVEAFSCRWNWLAENARARVSYTDEQGECWTLCATKNKGTFRGGKRVDTCDIRLVVQKVVEGKPPTRHELGWKVKVMIENNPKKNVRLRHDENVIICILLSWSNSDVYLIHPHGNSSWLVVRGAGWWQQEIKVELEYEFWISIGSESAVISILYTTLHTFEGIVKTRSVLVP